MFVSYPYYKYNLIMCVIVNIQFKNISNDLLAKLQYNLANMCVTEITTCFSKCFVNNITSEVLKVFSTRAERRDYLDENKTPRNLFNVPESSITQDSTFLNDFYYNPRVLELIKSISSENVSYVPFAGERFIINGLVNENDSQGWHWDDYAYSLVIIAKAAESDCGGQLEYIPHVAWDRHNNCMDEILALNKIYRRSFSTGQVYLMRSDNVLHRVSCIKSNSQRVAFVCAYRNDADLNKDLSHFSTLQLAGKL